MTTAAVRRLVAPCVRACPLGIDIPKYVGFIAQGNYSAAIATVRERMPLPGVCGHICFHLCENECRRGRVDQPVAIRELKRFVAYQDDLAWRARETRRPLAGMRAAVVGSGPAGFACAYYLAKLGHCVTIFEAHPFLGGMLRTGIPRFRLPRAILDKELAQLEELGVTLKLNSPVESVDELFGQGYQAVFLGLGAQDGSSLSIEGEELAGVSDAVSFLGKANLGEKLPVGPKVMVVGGGNVAVDAARTALRLGATDVTMLYRRTRAEMPADVAEIAATECEGITIEFLAAPVLVRQADGHLQVQSIRMQLGEPDASGRPRPVPLEGSEFWTEVDTLLAAIGQRCQVPSQIGITVTRWGTVEANAETLATSRDGVFSGGDVVLGPASFAEAVAQGRKAAASMDAYLGGHGNIEEALSPEYAVRPQDVTEVPDSPRVHVAEITRGERCSSFGLVELGYSEAQAIEEAHRCLKCDQWKQAQPKLWLARKGKGAD
ncbi:MAG: FAD-dependent oxidoreductase [Chloroflexi bacterium]|nr:FAD-dependent oxidoreductase [Chloroflexota bacterium]